MENVTYYFTSNKNEEELKKIISDPLFNRIVEYLSERKEQEVILRQIKAAILTEANLELFLDKLIKYDLLERKNRRYSLSFPIFSNKNPFQIQITDSITHLLKENIKLEQTSNSFVFGEWLWSLLFKAEQEDYFFGVKDRSTIFNRVEVGNETLRFVSVYADKMIPLDLANYFDLLSKRRELPEHFEPLQKIIGDVDINYFIPQIQKVIRSIKRNSLREGKVNIFQEALLVTKDLIKTDENQFFLATPILENHVSSDVLENLREELILLWQGIDDKNEQVFFKQQLFSILFTHCLPKSDSLSYFKY